MIKYPCISSRRTKEFEPGFHLGGRAKEFEQWLFMGGDVSSKFSTFRGEKLSRGRSGSHDPPLYTALPSSPQEIAYCSVILMDKTGKYYVPLPSCENPDARKHFSLPSFARFSSSVVRSDKRSASQTVYRGILVCRNGRLICAARLGILFLRKIAKLMRQRKTDGQIKKATIK
jgi:hypothetical protein